MRQRLFMDMIHLTIDAPHDLDKTDIARIRRTLGSARFQMRLREAVDDVVTCFRSLHQVRVTVSS